MRFIISDERVNRYGYRILSKGMSTSSFEKNPVIFYNHDTFSLPIGKGKDLRHEPDGSITLEVDFDQEDAQALAVQKKAERGFLNACSVGIDVLETSADQSVLLPGQTRPTVTRSELLELSICGIPGNRNALRLNGVQTENMNQILPLINQKELNMKPAFDSFDLPETAAEEDILEQLAALEALDPEAADSILARLDAIDKKITALATSKKSTEKSTETTKKVPRLSDLMKDLRADGSSKQQENMSWEKLMKLSDQDFEAFRREHRAQYDQLFYGHYGFEPRY